MEQTTIATLNQLNKIFYQTVAEHFNSSRNYFWQGWKQLVPFLPNTKRPITVLDIGCGNGRFAAFLEEQGYSFEYYGLDASEKLLNFASQQLHLKNKTHFLQVDLIDLLEQDLFSDFLEKNGLPTQFDCVVCFGVLHHIPSAQLRSQFLEVISDLSHGDGLAVVTAWLFLKNPTLEKRILSDEELETVGLAKKDLEENDFILDWQRGKSAYRYCHYTDQKEMEQLFKNTPLRMVETYVADSKTNDLNQYYLLKKGK